MNPRTLATTRELADFCESASACPFVTVDTEFMRERTYYSKLCLIQLAFPGSGDDSAVLVDPLAESLALEPLFDLFRDNSTVKVFHAARQDIEIFWQVGAVMPKPLFDTQVAAMVCGFGDQVGYERLVRKICRKGLDKGSRVTDWSRRPLNDSQKSYALGDVTHLREIYVWLVDELERTGRAKWVDEELALLVDPATYELDPQEAWRRVKHRSRSGRFLAILRELAAFRELRARELDQPRSRVFKDEAMVEIAAAKPRKMGDLERLRMVFREARKGAVAEGILDAVRTGLELPESELPQVEQPEERAMPDPALAELLRVLLKSRTESSGVAGKLVASAAVLDAIAAGERDLPALRGWRHEVFGSDALRLCEGKIALAARDGKVEVVEL